MGEKSVVRRRGLEEAVGGFHFEHAALCFDATGGGETGEFAVGAQHAVTGDEDRPGVGPQGGADGAGGARFSNLAGELAIGETLAARDGGGGFEDGLLEGGEGGPVKAVAPEGPGDGVITADVVADGVGVIGAEKADEFGKPGGDDFGVEIAFAVAEDFVAVGVAGEDLGTQFGRG